MEERVVSQSILKLTFPARSGLEFTGERYVPGVGGQLQYEHFHRYLAARPLAVAKDVLDIGCGEGYGSWSLSQVAKSVRGVDIAKCAVDHALNTYRADNLTFKTGSITAIPYEDASFDVAVCLETIEHVDDQAEAVAELRRVVRPGGLLLISTPNAAADDGARHEANPFHKRELTLAQFVDLLSEKFSRIKLAEQRFVHGSVLADVGSILAEDRRARFESIDGSNYTAINGHLGQSYFVAIASDVEVSGLGLTVLDAERDFRALESQFQDAVHQVHLADTAAKEREEFLTATRAELAETQAELAVARAELKKFQSWRDLAKIQIAHLRLRATAAS